MASKSNSKDIIKFDHTIKQDSPVPEASGENGLGEIAIKEIQLYLRKYSTTSSVFAEQSISNPDYQRTLYCISCILQAELFDDLKNAAIGSMLHPDLAIETTLPPHLGGPVERVPEDILDRECQDDPELRREILAGTVPTVDTILRFISWVHQSANYSAQCNIVAFIYVKRMMDAKAILTVRNWRGMWLGAVVLAQKVFDDCSLRTSSFASILPGVTKSELKALEFKVFSMLNFCTGVKPSVYARFYFELREIFKSITGEFRDATLLPERAPRRRPLTIKNGEILRQCADDLTGANSVTRSSRSTSKATSPRSKKVSAGSRSASSATSASVVSLPPAMSPTAIQQQQSLLHRAGSCSNQQESSSDLRLPLIQQTGRSPLGQAAGVGGAAGGCGRASDDGAGTLQLHTPHSAGNCNPQDGRKSAATSPGAAAARGGRRPEQRSAVTLEDFDFVNPSIFVLS